MDINIENFLGLNAVFVILLVVYFLRAKNSSLRPSKLKFEKQGVSGNASTVSEGKTLMTTELGDERDLNVMFNFNGYTWDAFEVLGIPAGSSMESAKEAHQKLIAHCDVSSRELYDKALLAIKLKS